MSAQEKKQKRLRPWLERLLNQGDINGLQWIDEDRTKFRIVWKHHGKQNWSPEHGRVFMVSVGQCFSTFCCSGTLYKCQNHSRNPMACSDP